MEKDKKEKLKKAATIAGAAVLGGSTAEAAILFNAPAEDIQEPIPTPPPGPEPVPPIPEPIPPVPEPAPPVPEPINSGEPQPQNDDTTGLLHPVGPDEPVGPDVIPPCEYGPPPCGLGDDPIIIDELMYAGPDVMEGLDSTDMCVDPIDL